MKVKKSNIVTTTSRYPGEFYEEIKTAADRDGNTVNGMMLMWARLGQKLYNAKFVAHINIEETEQNHSFSSSKT